MVQVRIRRLLLWVALPALTLVLLYTVLGFLVVPRLVRSGVHDFVAKSYHREVAIGDVRFNPYTLRLDIRDFSLPDGDGQPLLAFRHLLVDLTVASIWRWGPDFEAILLEQPFARVLIKRDGTLNFSELELPPSPDAKPEPNPKPVRLFINHFSVQGGNVAFEDQAHPSAFRTEIKPITFELRNFATVGKAGGTYALSGVSDAGERFTWSGSLKTYPLASQGQFEIGNLQAHTIWNYLRDSVQFELPSGLISIAGDYNFSAATSPVGLGVNVHNVTITDLGVRPRGATDDYIKVMRLEVNDTRADVAKHTVVVGSVHLAGAEVRAWAPGNAGVAVNLMELVGPSTAQGPNAAQGPAAAETGITSPAPTASTVSAPAEPTGGAPPAPPGSAPASTASAPTPVAHPNGGGPADAAAPGALPAPAGAPAWVVSVPDIALDNIKISAEDRQISPAVPMNLDDLSIHVTGFTTAKTTPVAVVMSTKINREGKLEAKADLSPDLAAMKVQADLTDFNLTVFQPYIARQTAMTLRNGLLSTKLNVDRAADGHLAVGGEIDVTKLKTIDNDLKRDFIKFDRLQIAGIEYQGDPSNPAKPASLHIHNVVAHAPYARVIIESDRTVNVGRVLSGPGGTPSKTAASNASTSSPDKSAADAKGAAIGGVASADVKPATTDGVASAAVAAADSPDAHAAISVGTAPAPSPTAASPTAASSTAPTTAPVRSAANAAAPAASHRGDSKHHDGKHPEGKHHNGNSKQAPASSADSKMAIAVDAITIQDGSANYADLWIQPNFAVGIQSLNGSILGLSSSPRARAKVELKGKVDRYAPVHIWGETNPLAATTYSDIRMNFKGVELTSATPYSGHFAGYKIEKGKLSVDIDYKIENRKLTAAHKFVIDQLELGERVESPDAVHLPLKIAVALLKDRNGVIDIDLPVTGSLDDPQFKIGPLIWKAVLNLLTKIATAPFALLGRLFGGGEQMNFIDFHPGSAVLDATEHDKLVSLVKALKEKEKLELDVPITFSPDLDRPGLATAHLNARLLELSQEQAGGHKHGKGNKAGKGDSKTNIANAPAGGSADSAPTSAGADDPSRTVVALGKAAALGASVPDSTPSPLGAIIDQPPPSDPALTDPAQRYHLLVALYRTDFGKDSTLPALAQAIETAGKKKDQPPPDFGAANAELEAGLAEKSPVPDRELETLGKHRARAIQDVLLIGTDIDPSRVFVIGSAPKGPAEKDKVRVELALK
jgi:hypothetical protein